MWVKELFWRPRRVEDVTALLTRRCDHMNYTDCEFGFDRVEETKAHIRDTDVS